MANSFANVTQALDEVSVEEDLKKYADSKGTGMGMNWPKYVVSRNYEFNKWLAFCIIIIFVPVKSKLYVVLVYIGWFARNNW